MQTVFDYYCDKLNAEVSVEWSFRRMNELGRIGPIYKPARYDCLYNANYICEFFSQCPYESEFMKLSRQWMEENN